MSSTSSLQSENSPSGFTQTIRRFFSTSSRADDSYPTLVDDSVIVSASDSEPQAQAQAELDTLNDLQVDCDMDAILAMSLELLNVGSVLVVGFPVVGEIVRIIREVLKMRNQVKQHKKKCEEVMRKLANFAQILTNVEPCRKCHDKGDFAILLGTTLGELRRKLDEVKRVVEKCAKATGLRVILQRNALLKKVERCDVELTNLFLDALFQLSVKHHEMHRNKHKRSRFFSLKRVTNALKLALQRFS